MARGLLTAANYNCNQGIVSTLERHAQYHQPAGVFNYNYRYCQLFTLLTKSTAVVTLIQHTLS